MVALRPQLCEARESHSPRALSPARAFDLGGCEFGQQGTGGISAAVHLAW